MRLKIINTFSLNASDKLGVDKVLKRSQVEEVKDISEYSESTIIISCHYVVHFNIILKYLRLILMKIYRIW